MRPAPPLLVFADLDHTLPDSSNGCACSPAQAAVDRLNSRAVPVIVCSSRTRAEIERLRQHLSIAHPFMCECGAAVFIPRGYFPFELPDTREVAGYEVVELGPRYPEVVNTLHRAADRAGVNVVGFSDMSVEDVAVDCEVTLLQAQLAKLREYAEPFRVVDPEGGAPRQLLKGLRAAGLTCTVRGRYYHAGAAIGYEAGARLLTDWYRRAFGPVVTAAFSDNDEAASLLRSVDFALIVENGERTLTRLRTGVPDARVADADCVDDWAGIVINMAEAAAVRRQS